MNEALRLTAVREDAALAAELDALDALSPGPELAARLAALPTDGPRLTSDPHQRVRIAARWAALATWAEAQSLHEIAAGAAAVDALHDHLEAIHYRTDLALAARCSETWADRQIDLATVLAERLPAMIGALTAGSLTVTHARRLADVLDTAEPATARHIDSVLTRRAVQRHWTPGELATAARRMLLRLDPDGGAQRHDQALDREANVTGGGLPDGLGWLTANGDAVTIADILATVDDRADHLAALAPDTPVGRLRFAALGDLVLGQNFTLFDHVLGQHLADGAEPAEGTELAVGTCEIEGAVAAGANKRQPRPRRRREVIVTIDLLTLLGLRENPAELCGYGPIPARIARLLTDDASLRRLITDPVTGDPLHLDRRARVASPLLAAAVRAVQHTCQFPGCTRAHTPDIDHRNDWTDGGPTNPDNLQLLCKRHHALKTAGLWTCHPQPDGSTTWTGPDGQQATRHPERDTG